MAISSKSKISELTNRHNEMKERNNFVGDISNLVMAIDQVDWSDVPHGSKKMTIRQVFKNNVDLHDYLPSEGEQIMAWLTGERWSEEDEKDHQLSLLPVYAQNN